MSKTVRKLRTRAQWAARIRVAHKDTVKAVLKLGHTLMAAKKALPHGEFLKMIGDDLPFTASTAQRLMKIASDPKIANAARAQLLPPHWGALYELTKLPAQTFEQAAASGAIHPDMTRADAAKFVTVEVIHEPPKRLSPVYVTHEPTPLLPTSIPFVKAPPLHLSEKLEKLESVVTDLNTEVIAAGSEAERRPMACAHKLLSLIGHGGESLH